MNRKVIIWTVVGALMIGAGLFVAVFMILPQFSNNCPMNH